MKISKHLYALAIAGAVSVVPAMGQSYSVLYSGFTGGSVNSTYYAGGGVNIYQVKLDFTLNTTGAVTEANLTTWTVTFLDASSTALWTDNVVVGGVVQTIAGVSRTGNIDFNFNTTTQVMGSWDSMLNGNNLDSPSRISGGTVYNAWSNGATGVSMFASIQSGSNPAANQLPSQNFNATETVTNLNPVPEASGSVAGIGLAMAGLYQLRRRKAAAKVVES